MDINFYTKAIAVEGFLAGFGFAWAITCFFAGVWLLTILLFVVTAVLVSEMYGDVKDARDVCKGPK